MQVTKCDICKKEIKSYKEEVKIIAPGTLSMFAFCLACGAPVMRFLRSHNLLENDKKSSKK